MLTALAFALLLDPPDYAACEASPWQGHHDTLDLGVSDHVLGRFDGHPARIRICAEYSGFGYTRVSMIVWVVQDDGSEWIDRRELTTTACYADTVRRAGERVRVTIPVCSYHDDPDDIPSVFTQTLHWHDAPPRLTPNP